MRGADAHGLRMLLDGPVLAKTCFQLMHEHLQMLAPAVHCLHLFASIFAVAATEPDYEHIDQ